MTQCAMQHVPRVKKACIYCVVCSIRIRTIEHARKVSCQTLLALLPRSHPRQGP